MSILQAQYYATLSDHSGSVVAAFDHWRYLRYRKLVNAPTQVQFNLGSNDPKRLLFDFDNQLKIYRQYPSGSWYVDCESLDRSHYEGEMSSGRRFFTSYQRGYVDLLNRRIIIGFAGTTYTEKSGAAETVMKEFVDEQMVSGAIARAMHNFSVQADGGQGNAITVRKAWRNLLEVLQSLIDEVGGGDFDVIGTAPATFQFQFFIGQRGADRRLGNTVGNDPVVFSLNAGTLASASQTYNRMGEINAVYVGGQRQGSGRDVELVEDNTAILDTPWNRLEAFRDASNVTTTAGLQDVGDGVLQQNQGKLDYKFDLAQSPALIYGRDYELGDLVTIEFDGGLIDKKIVEVDIRVQREETINIVVADIPSA